MGAAPSHPELLDWMAIRFMKDHKWSVKSLHREIVMPPTYRRSLASARPFSTREPALRPRPARQALRGTSSRPGPRGQRPSQREDARQECDAAAAPRALELALQRRQVDSRRGGGSLPSRAVHVLEAHHALPVDDDVRLTHPGHGGVAAHPHEHPAPGAGDVERPRLRGGIAGARATHGERRHRARRTAEDRLPARLGNGSEPGNARAAAAIVRHVRSPLYRQRPALLRNAVTPYIPYDTAGMSSGTKYGKKSDYVRAKVETPAWAARPVPDSVRVAALTAVAGAILNLDAFLTKQ